MKLGFARIAFLAVPLALGQQPGGRLTFEVASVKASGPISFKNADEVKRGAGIQVDGARLDGSMVSLADLIQRAYDVKSFQVSGPGWISSDRYDVHAKLPSGATTDQVPAMLQTLLADRFRMAFHRDSREHAVYALTVGKNGIKIPAAGAGGADNKQEKKSEAAFHFSRKMTMAELGDFLGRFVDRPVVDATGLTGPYQVEFDIPAEDLKRAKMAAEGVHGGDSAGDPAGGSVIFASLQQLGLRAEPRKMAVDFLVVDHAEKVPTEN
jgi:uncharacterized protein (TIGR03435 family)